MSVEVKIGTYKTFTWSCANDFSIIGNVSVAEQNLIEHFLRNVIENTEKITDSYIKQTLEKVNNHFSAILENNDYVIVLTDHMNAFPLFYCLNERNEVLSVHDNPLMYSGNMNRDEIGFQEFLCTYTTIGERTLWNDVKGIPCGTLFVISKTDGSFKKYKYWEPGWHGASKDPDSLCLSSTIDQMFSELVSRYRNTPILLPLTGGTDSRGIAVYLREYGHQNIKAFTFGQHNDSDVVVAQDLAKKLGIPWTFIETSKDSWQKYRESNLWESLAKYSLSGGRLPAQSISFALDAVKRSHFADEEYLVIPGYCGEVMGQILQHIPKAKSNIAKRKLSSLIFNHICYTWDGDKNKKKIVLDSIDRELPDKKEFTPEEYYFLWTKFQLEHYTQKFVLNWVRAFELNGFSWETPWFSKQWCQYWSGVPYDFFYGKRLYNETLSLGAQDLGIDYPVEYSSGDPVHWMYFPRFSSHVRRVKELLKGENGMYGLMYFAQAFGFNQSDYQRLVKKLNNPKELYNAWLLQDTIKETEI